MAFEKMTIRVISMDEDYAKSIVDFYILWPKNIIISQTLITRKQIEGCFNKHPSYIIFL